MTKKLSFTESDLSLLRYTKDTAGQSAWGQYEDMGGRGGMMGRGTGPPNLDAWGIKQVE